MLIYGVGNWAVNSYKYYKYNMQQYEVENFGKNRRYFNVLAKSLYPIFENEYAINNELQYVAVYPSVDDWNVIYVYNDLSDRKEEIAMTEKEKNALPYMYKAFPFGIYGFVGFTLRSYGVEFMTGYPYSVIWSKSGGKPKDIPTIEGYKPVFQKKLSFFSLHWYQCIYK